MDKISKELEIQLVLGTIPEVYYTRIAMGDGIIYPVYAAYLLSTEQLSEKKAYQLLCQFDSRSKLATLDHFPLEYFRFSLKTLIIKGTAKMFVPEQNEEWTWKVIKSEIHTKYLILLVEITHLNTG